MNPASPEFPKLVVDRAAELWRVSAKDLMAHQNGERGPQLEAEARFAVVHVLRVAGWKREEVLRFFKMDYSGAHHAEKRAEELRTTDKLYAMRLDLLLGCLDGVRLLPDDVKAVNSKALKGGIPA